tara:strand:- start:829 stop:1179 length:351 start_codon:yes stop_codon:yes gene_type:complete
MNCCICLEDSEENEIFICGHNTCKRCYEQLIKNTNKCPLCRAIIIENGKGETKTDTEDEIIIEIIIEIREVRLTRNRRRNFKTLEEKLKHRQRVKNKMKQERERSGRRLNKLLRCL